VLTDRFFYESSHAVMLELMPLKELFVLNGQFLAIYICMACSVFKHQAHRCIIPYYVLKVV